MKKILLLILGMICFLGIFISYKLYFQKNIFFPQTFNFAIVDLQQIFSEAPQVTLLRDKVNDQFNARRENIAALEAAIKKESAKLNRPNAILKLKERKQILSDLFSKQKKLLKMQKELQDDVTFMEKASTETVIKQIQYISVDLAKEHHVSLILKKNIVAYSGNRLDLSLEVINALKRE